MVALPVLSSDLACRIERHIGEGALQDADEDRVVVLVVAPDLRAELRDARAQLVLADEDAPRAVRRHQRAVTNVESVRSALRRAAAARAASRVAKAPTRTR